MNILTGIIIALLVLIIIALIANQKFKIVERWKESGRIQKHYDTLHDKYKDLLNK